MTSKHCRKCKKIKLLSEFYVMKAGKNGRQPVCKPCDNSTKMMYGRTKNGFISAIFNNQVVNSKRRGNDNPEYSVDELREWAFSQQLFHELYDKWVESGYDVMLRPSLDRADDYQRYSLDRLKVMTWRENKSKGYIDRINGINNKQNKSVVQMNIDGEFVAEHYSMCSAERKTGIHQASISYCCKGKRKVAGGFRWMYSAGIPIANNKVAL